MSFSRKAQAYQAVRDKQKADHEKILGLILKNCSVCEVSSGKRRLFDLQEGLICITCCNLKGMNAVQAHDAEELYKAHLEAERNKPRPENFGEWA